MSTIENILKKAMNESKQVSFSYDGYERIVNPHHYGIFGTKNYLHAYQTGGQSSKEKIPCWKHFNFEKIKDLEITTNEFSIPSPGYNSNHPHYSNVVQVTMPTRPKGP